MFSEQPNITRFEWVHFVLSAIAVFGVASCVTAQSHAVRPAVTASHFSGALNGAESIAEGRAARVLAELGDALSVCEIEVGAETMPEGSSTPTDDPASGNRDRIVVDVVALCPDRTWRGTGDAVATYAEIWSSSVDAARRDSTHRALELAVELAAFELLESIRASWVDMSSDSE